MKYHQFQIKLSQPALTGKESYYTTKAFEKNEVSNYGENIRCFEQHIEKIVGQNKMAIALQSGTSALHLAMIMLGVQKDDEVICPTFTFIATINPICYLHAQPVFVDSEPETGNMCPKLLEEAILHRIHHYKKPKAIVAVHSYGMPAKIDEIIYIAKKYDIPVIEDAAPALGSYFKNQHCGTFGNFGVFSFNGNKIATGSGGGILLVNTKEEKQKAIAIANQAKKNVDYYEHFQVGYNYRMSNIVAGVARAQVEVLETRVKWHNQLHHWYKNLFSNTSQIELKSVVNDLFNPNYWQNLILFSEEKFRDDFKNELLNNKIECKLPWKPMHTQAIFKNCPAFVNEVSTSWFTRGLCLPSGSSITENDKTYIAQVIHKLI
ncbi:DegT/DnrJ/EryC1/StrS family aminotransferase [Zhouia sp. PK063]|uniref:DegT/DnrJ/EryC1/StrS family aminotransferase n=1 Tax=Zhouia sp. PK063 TaxID=3373602 RepID=UPI00379DD991